VTFDISTPWWDDPSGSWDTVVLGGYVFPGIVTISGAVERDIEVKKAKGEDGATLKDNGYSPAQVDINLRVKDEEEWMALQMLLPNIHPRTKGGERSPVSLVNPVPNLLGVNSIYIKKIGFPVLLDTKEVSIDISGFEWQQQPKKVKKGAGGGASGSGQGNLSDEELVEQAVDDLSEDELAEARRLYEEEQGAYGEEWTDDEDVEQAVEDYQTQQEFMDEYYGGSGEPDDFGYGDGGTYSDEDEVSKLTEDAEQNTQDQSGFDDESW